MCEQEDGRAPWEPCRCVLPLRSSSASGLQAGQSTNPTPWFRNQSVDQAPDTPYCANGRWPRPPQSASGELSGPAIPGSDRIRLPGSLAPRAGLCCCSQAPPPGLRLPSPSTPQTHKQPCQGQLLLAKAGLEPTSIRPRAPISCLVLGFLCALFPLSDPRLTPYRVRSTSSIDWPASVGDSRTGGSNDRLGRRAGKGPTISKTQTPVDSSAARHHTPPHQSSPLSGTATRRSSRPSRLPVDPVRCQRPAFLVPNTHQPGHLSPDPSSAFRSLPRRSTAET